MACGFLDWKCSAAEGIVGAIADGLEGIANSVLQGVGKVMGEIAVMWVKIKTPVLINGAGAADRTAGDHVDAGGGFAEVLGWVQAFAFGVMVLCLIAAGVRLATGERHETRDSVRRIGTVLLATIIVAAAASLARGVLDPALFSRGSAPVAYIQGSLYWYMGGVTIIGIIVGAVRLAWTQRAEAGADLVKSLLTLIVVSGAGLSAVGLLTVISDEFATWILNGAMDCPLDADGTCFTQQMGALTIGTSELGTFGSMLVISLGALTLVVGIIQVLLMIVRSAMLVILAGVLPISAAATNTEVGKQMFQKVLGWMLGMILYKPAAAIVYATAFQLIGVDTFGDSDLTTTIVGLTMIVLAVIAMPALLALIVPATSAVASGGGMATAGVMAASAIPAGSRQPTGSATPGATGGGTAAAGAPAGTTAGGASGSAMPGAGTSPVAPAVGSSGSPAGPGGSGPAGSTGQPGPAGRPSGAGSPSGGVAAGGGASGAVAAAGHVGAVLAAAQAVQGAASSSVTDQGGPSGAGS